MQDAAHVDGGGVRCTRAALRRIPAGLMVLFDDGAHRTLPPSVTWAPLMRMSTLLNLAPLSSVTLVRMSVLAWTVLSQMEPPSAGTRPGSRRTAVRPGILMGATSDKASRPPSSVQSARTSWAWMPRASAAAALARLVSAWVLILLWPLYCRLGAAAAAAWLMSAAPFMWAVPLMRRSAGR